MPDLDFFIFLFTIGATVFLSPGRLRKTARLIPRVYIFEEVDPSSLTLQQRSYLEVQDAKLAPLHYYPVCTYRIANYVPNLLRSYIRSGDNARCVVMIVELAVKVGDTNAVHHSCVTEFITKLPNDGSLMTRNMGLKSLMDQPPEKIVQECPNLYDPKELKRRHDLRAATMGNMLPPAADARAIFQEVQSGHERFSQFQVQRGILRFDPARDGYTTTDKAHWRGIRNHFNPFVQPFPIARFAPAVLAGALLPLLGMIQLAPRITQWLGPTIFSGVLVSSVVILAFYIAAGAAIGILLERATFLWGFLLTYLAVHLALGWTAGMIPYSTLAGLAAFYATQFRSRRKLIILPQANA